MRAAILTLLALRAATFAFAAPAPQTPEEQDIAISLDELKALANQAFETAKAEAENGVLVERSGGSGCSLSKLKIRREWSSLSKNEKESYISAVKCLQSKPPKTPSSLAPGAKTRFDDFVATHINQTLSIHYTGNFLAWHRYYTWLYEEALQNECGYTGTQPYWDWSLSSLIGLENHPLWDGSDTSVSGDGEFIPDREDVILGLSLGLPPIYLPPGTGGGCVTSGPFKDMEVNLGPVALDTYGGNQESNPDGPLAYNPRCLKRDLSDWVNDRFANATSVVKLILQSSTIEEFQNTMEGIPGTGEMGVHGGGHYSMGGDPGRDVFASPGDPAFYFHHAMIDRVWWIWQMLKPSKRVFSEDAVGLTNTFLNNPPSEATTREDMVEYGYAAGPPRKIGELLDTLGGPFCYIYL